MTNEAEANGVVDKQWHEKTTDFITFKEENIQVLKFLEDDPIIGKVTFRDKTVPKWSWQVEKNGIEKTLDVTAKGFLGGLKPHRPLKDKTLRVTKEGSGTDTVYKVEEVSEATPSGESSAGKPYEPAGQMEL